MTTNMPNGNSEMPDALVSNTTLNAPSCRPTTAPASAATGADTTPPAPPAPTESENPVLNPPALAESGGDQDDLKARIAEANLNLSDRQDALQLAKQELSDAQNELARLEALLKDDPVSGGNPITAYLRQQQKNLEERGARKALIKESGLDLKQLAKDLKSPLDAAMERKNSRGAQRPARG